MDANNFVALESNELFMAEEHADRVLRHLATHIYCLFVIPGTSKLDTRTDDTKVQFAFG